VCQCEFQLHSVICSRQATGSSGAKILATSRQLSDWFRLGGLLAVVDSSSSTDYHQVREISQSKPSPPPPQPFDGPFSGTSRLAGATRELLDFMVQGKINRGRHTDHLAGRHSIRTNQCPPPPSPHFLQAGCPSCCPTNSVKALKATSAFGLKKRC